MESIGFTLRRDKRGPQASAPARKKGPQCVAADPEGKHRPVKLSGSHVKFGIGLVLVFCILGAVFILCFRGFGLQNFALSCCTFCTLASRLPCSFLNFLLSLVFLRLHGCRTRVIGHWARHLFTFEYTANNLLAD